MFGSNITGSSLSLSKVLSGISKALNIANQAIPIYKEIKPIAQNARKIMGVLKEFNSSSDSKPQKNIKENKSIEKKEVKMISTSSKPVFFQ